MWLVLLAGCRPTASGVVVSEGAPVPGAVVEAVVGPAFDAVTDDAGRYRVQVEPGARTIRVTHPAHLPAEVEIRVEGRGTVEVPEVSLVEIPVDPGMFFLRSGAFEAPGAARVVREGSTKDGFRWCVDRAEGLPFTVPAGTVRLLDNHAADWRVFTLDASGCAYALVPTPGGFFDQKAQRVEVRRMEAYGVGRDWVEVDLAAGEYLFADWFEGGLVPEAEGWRGSWVKAG